MKSEIRNVSRAEQLIVGLLLGLIMFTGQVLAADATINAEDFSGLSGARAQSVSELEILGLRLADDEQVDLILSRVQPFAPDAFVSLGGNDRQPLVSERVYFRGTAATNSRAQASLSVGADGSLRGVLVDSRGHWRLLSRGGRIEARLVNDETVRKSDDHEPFQCGLDNEIRQTSREAQEQLDLANPQSSPPSRGDNNRYRVRVAYDTTARFVNLFGTGQQAIDYLGDLTNYISTVYIAELNTEIVISSTTLRNAGNEPWDVNADLLPQFENFWNNPGNTVDQTRTLAHLVDAGPSQGVAYVGALCVDGFDYGVSQGLGTEFDPTDDPQQWSFTVVAHELGHNFGSDHTHCYAPVVDECHNGEADPMNTCWAGAESLPGPINQQSGTIMSYCHLLNGGLNNIAVTFGLNHNFGVQPERVPNTMRNHVLARADQNNPRCPQLAGPPTNFTVTPSAGANGNIAPNTPQVVEQGMTTAFTVTPDAGFTAQVVGTCGGNLVGNTFTTAPVSQDCTVQAQFVAQQAGFCEQADLAIPDNDPAGIASTQTLPADGNIQKLEVALEIDHTWVGDLVVELQHPSGATVRLINRPDCDGDNIATILDDDAALSIQDNCQNGDPAYPEARYRPANALNAFNGLTTAGLWTLNVSDNEGGDTGTLRQWCLQPTVTAPPPSYTVTPSAGANGNIAPNTPQNVAQGMTTAFTVTPDAGFTATVVGTCGGNLVGNTFTTAPVNQDCTVQAQFEAQAGFCEQADLAIPDDDANGIASTLTLPAEGNIEKLEVALDIEHTWVGDLVVELQHPSGASVRLIDRPGLDCNGDDIDTILDDDATPSIEDDCQNDGPAYPEARYRPANALSGFNGLPATGLWTLTVSDNFSGDEGTIRQWCLQPTVGGVDIFADRFEN